jgi:hypothetical protein
MLLLNAFSLGMLPDLNVNIELEEMSLANVRILFEAEGLESAVGHQDAADLYGELLGMDVAFNRVSNTLKVGDCAIVGQYKGPRLPEGATTLPDGAEIRWIYVSITDEEDDEKH